VLRVSPAVALAYVQDHFDTRDLQDSDRGIRVKACPNPRCEHDKWAVRFHPQSQYFTCYRCGERVKLLNLVMSQLGTKSLKVAFKHLSQYGDLHFTWDRKPEAGETRGQLLKQVLRESTAGESKRTMDVLDLTHFSTDWDHPVGQAMVDYAIKRKVPAELLSSGRVGYFKHGLLAGRLSFLVHENGVPVYAMARAIRDEVKPKYLTSPPSMCGGRSSTDVVAYLDLVEPGSVVPVLEGALSAISTGPNAVAVLGNIVSEVQAGKILQKEPVATVLLREQGISDLHLQESAEVLRRKGHFVLTADLINGDPNEDSDQLPEVFNSAKESTRKSLLEAKIKTRLR
jgi:hypothetical protein